MTHRVITAKCIHYTLIGNQDDSQATKQSEWGGNSKKWLNLYIQSSSQTTTACRGCGFCKLLLAPHWEGTRDSLIQ